MVLALCLLAAAAVSPQGARAQSADATVASSDGDKTGGAVVGVFTSALNVTFDDAQAVDVAFCSVGQCRLTRCQYQNPRESAPGFSA